jgi:hypothetical protein
VMFADLNYPKPPKIRLFSTIVTDQVPVESRLEGY